MAKRTGRRKSPIRIIPEESRVIIVDNDQRKYLGDKEIYVEVDPHKAQNRCAVFLSEYSRTHV